MCLVVRTVRDPKQLTNAARRQIESIDRDQTVSQIQTMDEVLEASFVQRRLTLLLPVIFAGLARCWQIPANVNRCCSLW